MSGRMLGLTLRLEEAVTERVVPTNKAWETTGMPRLYVVGRYRMGFSISPQETGAAFTVFIDHDDPPGFLALLGWLLGGLYARWCVTSMADGVAEHFEAVA